MIDNNADIVSSLSNGKILLIDLPLACLLVSGMSKTLIENMLHHDGVGLSANQIGMDVRAFAMVRDIEYNDVIVCFNPRIVTRSDECVWCEEGCLSFPDQFINVQRPDKIIVKYEDEEGKDHKISLSGFASRVFQHEFDHLNGIDFTQRQ